MKQIVFDCEANGLLDEATKIHCIVLKDMVTGEMRGYDTSQIESAISDLQGAELLVGHNIIGYDIPLIQKFYLSFQPRASIIDTKFLSAMLFPEMKAEDFVRAAKDHTFPKKMIGRHSLEAWGHRLKDFKGEFGKTTDWKEYSTEMLDYCIQDVNLTEHLFGYLFARSMPGESIDIEMRAAQILFEQERCGIKFNVPAARDLLIKLYHRRDVIEKEMNANFGSWTIEQADFVPKVNNKARGYVKGVPVKRTKTITFNCSSREHIGNRLMAVYGWEPILFGGNGKPTVDESTLEGLDYPVIPKLIEYLLLDKRIGQIGDGNQAWLKVENKGRIYGTVHPTGAVTGRSAHVSPNMSQVPRVGKPYGEECRSLFMADDGTWLLVGTDASGLELRMLGHFLGRYDGGAYAKAVVEGDVHSITMDALGITDRDQAKTFIYAFLYGAGNAKLALILGCSEMRASKFKNQFIAKIPGLRALKQAVNGAAERGYIIALDGRKLRVRSQHSALNTLLQGAGASVMKYALVTYYETLANKKIPHHPALFSHDEIQTNCMAGFAEEAGKICVASIVNAGIHYGLRLPLDAKYKVGKTWAETH